MGYKVHAPLGDAAGYHSFHGGSRIGKFWPKPINHLAPGDPAGGRLGTTYWMPTIRDGGVLSTTVATSSQRHFPFHFFSHRSLLIANAGSSFVIIYVLFLHLCWKPPTPNQSSLVPPSALLLLLVLGYFPYKPQRKSRTVNTHHLTRVQERTPFLFRLQSITLQNLFRSEQLSGERVGVGSIGPQKIPIRILIHSSPIHLK